jgi:hypothetical protein
MKQAITDFVVVAIKLFALIVISYLSNNCVDSFNILPHRQDFSEIL